jgi:hypothetical protein
MAASSTVLIYRISSFQAKHCNSVLERYCWYTVRSEAKINLF